MYIHAVSQLSIRATGDLECTWINCNYHGFSLGGTDMDKDAGLQGATAWRRRGHEIVVLACTHAEPTSEESLIRSFF